MEHAIRGLHSVTLTEQQIDTHRGDAHPAARHEHRCRGSGSARFAMAEGSAGALVDVATGGDQRDLQAGGTVHHIAFRAPDLETMNRWQGELINAGVAVPRSGTGVPQVDLLREPGGVLVEIATDSPASTSRAAARARQAPQAAAVAGTDATNRRGAPLAGRPTGSADPAAAAGTFSLEVTPRQSLRCSSTPPAAPPDPRRSCRGRRPRRSRAAEGSPPAARRCPARAGPCRPTAGPPTGQRHRVGSDPSGGRSRCQRSGRVDGQPAVGKRFLDEHRIPDPCASASAARRTARAGSRSTARRRTAWHHRRPRGAGSYRLGLPGPDVGNPCRTPRRAAAPARPAARRLEQRAVEVSGHLVEGQAPPSSSRVSRHGS